MPRDTQRVFVGNLAPDVRPRDLEDFFKGYGRLGDISLKNGYGFVDFDDVRYLNSNYAASRLYLSL